MTVKELIERLQECDQDAVVTFGAYEGAAPQDVRLFENKRRERWNSVRGWGDDIVATSVEIYGGQDLVVMEPNQD